MSTSDINEITNIAIQSGALILENGGETYRAEDTIIYTARALGAKNPYAFVTPTIIIFSHTDAAGRAYTRMKRVSRRDVHLKRIAEVNNLSRRVSTRKNQSDPDEIESQLDAIQQLPVYAYPFQIAAAGLNSLFFSFMFGGTVIESGIAFIIGALLRCILMVFSRFQLNGFITSLLSGVFVSVVMELVFFFNVSSESVIISSAVLMQVVPGLAIVHAIRDMIAGDLVSGNARLAEAFMIAAGLSVGSIFGFGVFSGMLSV